jgi:uncharacterized protein (DUF362 family)
MKYDKSRRSFIKKSAGMAFALYGVSKLSHYLDDEVFAATDDHIVVVARDAKVIDTNLKVNFTIVRKMLNDSVMKLVGAKTPTDAWKSLFRSDDIVGVKVNTLSGKMMSSHLELVMAIVEGLRSANVKDVIIWDKSDSELQEAGFTINRKSNNKPRCFGTNPDIGYEADINMYGSIASQLSRIISHCTAFVNVPVLKHHTMAGVTLSMKNWFGAIHNPHKYHFDVNSKNKMVASCNYIPDVNSLILTELKKRQPLIVCDGIMSQYDRGPGYNPTKAWNYSGLIVSNDPVALDYIGTRIIEKKRQLEGLQSLSDIGREPEYIAIASDKSYNLGTNDPSNIKIVNIGNLTPEI